MKLPLLSQCLLPQRHKTEQHTDTGRCPCAGSQGDLSAGLGQYQLSVPVWKEKHFRRHNLRIKKKSIASGTGECRADFSMGLELAAHSCSG